ncbi:cyclic nucleotide-binding domain-containing protein [Frigidibacter albus]|uniref:Cyclic nucleotide-binding domain-containing protein n=1 Tax=Frigidibacter albus TaxID=1465486 RepID=A0A6L8VJZ0_9RHOB|nr:cation:proton antiporter [Frigidibacter albus]MZQ90668.1 cyclic nucleotide-binding domain-containing protein [Frigidibacter albus]NBE32676.1 cyclic nucleotide-binding domain-containing protein [Frigidibacter albus]GGH60343.1 sodium:proton antiporter [Frigidibacter albus]
MDLVVIIAIVAALFLVIGLSEPLAAKLRLPYSVILAAVGIAIGAAATFFWRTDLTDALNPVALAILNLPIRSNVFLYVFLPTLVFQVSLGLNLRRMLDDWVPVLVLAVVAVVVATVVIGFALLPFAGLPLAACLLIGAIVSTTDPSAVVSIFRATPAPQRLARIVEGESLLNDAAAIALFGLFVGFVTVGAEDPDLLAGLMRFPWIVAGGILAGAVAARVAVEIIARMPAHPLGQISVSVALPYLTYIGAEQLNASGVIGVVVAGLTLNLLAPGRFSPALTANLRDTWDLLAHWAGSLIFVLAALLIPRLLSDVRAFDLVLVGIVVLAAFAARAAILFIVLPLLTMVRLSPKVERPYRVAILWGGLRGAVTLALALAVTESRLVPPDIKRQVGILATGFTLFTLIVQGTSLRRVIAWLGLDKLSPLDTALGNQVIAVALQTVREGVAETARDFGLNRDIVRDEAKRFGERLDVAVRRADGMEDILDRDRITLGLVALAGRERDLILEEFRQQVIPAELAERLLAGADRIIEATRANGRTAYRAAARANLATGWRYRAAEALHNRAGLGRPLARLTEDRFDMLVTLGMILPDLHGFINDRIRRIHGRRVADLLHELLDRRAEETQKELEGLRLQFPGYAEMLERRLIRRTTLRLEEREYDALTEDGLIGPELRATLGDEIARRRGTLAARPTLDLKLQKSDLVAQFPLFSDLDASSRKMLAKRLRTIYVPPGEVILHRDGIPRQVWFIASGAVETVTAGTKHRLGRGEMFGQLALLARMRRRTQVVAITHCTLLALDEARFRTLLEKSAPLRRAVVDSAARRGVKLDPALFAKAGGTSGTAAALALTVAEAKAEAKVEAAEAEAALALPEPEAATAASTRPEKTTAEPASSAAPLPDTPAVAAQGDTPAEPELLPEIPAAAVPAAPEESTEPAEPEPAEAQDPLSAGRG